MDGLYDDSAEKSVLGGIINDTSLFVEVSGILKAEDFYRESHKLIFQAFVEEFERGSIPDIHLVTATLKKKGELEKVGGGDYLLDVAYSGSMLSLDRFARKVKELSLRRKLLENLKAIQIKVINPENSFNPVMEEAEKMIYDISEHAGESTGVLHIKNIDPEFREYTENVKTAQRTGSVPGLATHFPRLDKILTGLKPGQLIILAARPGQGKTTYALNIATNVFLKSRKPVLFFSLEMTRIELFIRIVAAESWIDSREFQRGIIRDADGPKISAAVNNIYASDFYLDDSPNLTSWDFRQRSRQLARTLEKSGKSLGLIVVDYLQLMQHGDGDGSRYESRQMEVARISHSLKIIAKDLKVPVLALSQMNRSIEQRGKDQKPQLSDLRESGAIEQDADIVMFIHQKEREEGSKEEDVADVIIAKHRAGPTGVVEMYFMKKYNIFHEIDRTEKFEEDAVTEY